MNNAESIIHDGEIPIYDAVKYLTKEEVEETVRRNAAAMNFDVNEEHMNVIHSLIEHYKQDCKTRDCLAAHEHMRFLEDAYEFKGGSKYLYMLFDAVPGARARWYRSTNSPVCLRCSWIRTRASGRRSESRPPPAAHIRSRTFRRRADDGWAGVRTGLTIVDPISRRSPAAGAIIRAWPSRVGRVENQPL